MCESKVSRNAPAFDRVRVNRGANSTAPKHTFALRMFERKKESERAPGADEHFKDKHSQ